MLRTGHSYDYVSMKDYNYNTLVQDYQFLSDVGRMVAQTGRDIADARILPSANGQKLRTAAQHRREHLAKQLSYRKLPVMLLPDGMSRRMENRSVWEPKRSALYLSAAFAFPRAKATSDPALARLSNGIVLHGQPSTSDMFRMLMDELENASAQAAGTSLAQWCVGAPENTQKRRRTAEDDARTTWRISKQLIEHLGLAIPHGTLDVGIYCALPDDAVLLLRIYPSKLRNESTPRFLEWWHKKGAARERGERFERMARSGPVVPLHVLDNVSRISGVDAPEDDERAPTRTLVRVETGGNSEAIPIEETLHRLPLDFGIVEFPELELWPKQSMLQAERRGDIHVLILHPKANGTDEPPMATNPPAMDAGESGPSTLVAYASSDDE